MYICLYGEAGIEASASRHELWESVQGLIAKGDVINCHVPLLISVVTFCRILSLS